MFKSFVVVAIAPKWTSSRAMSRMSVVPGSFVQKQFYSTAPGAKKKKAADDNPKQKSALDKARLKEKETVAQEKAKIAREKARQKAARDVEREKARRAKAVAAEKKEKERSKLKSEKENERIDKLKTKIMKRMKPTRPLTPWTLFIQENLPGRPSGQPVTAAFSGLSAKWKSLSDSQKKPYLERAAAALPAYQKALAEFNATLKPPTRPPNAYAFFLKEKSSSLFGSVTEKAKACGLLWKSINAKDKKPFAERAAAAKTKYDAEKKRFSEINWEFLFQNIRK